VFQGGGGGGKFVGAWTGAVTRLLARLLPHLQAAAEAAPEGPLRWSCLCFLADAVQQGGSPDESLPFYAEAAGQKYTRSERSPST